MASLFKQVQSTNSDEWLSYLKTLKYREKVKAVATKVQWRIDASKFDTKIETLAFEQRINNSKRLEPIPCSGAYYSKLF